MPRAIRTTKAEDLQDAAFRALADPTRRRILMRLAERDLPVAEIAKGLPISRPGVSKHLAVLRRAGLVSMRKAGRENRYHIESRQLREAAGYVRDVEEFWHEGLRGLDRTMETAGPQRARTGPANP